MVPIVIQSWLVINSHNKDDTTKIIQNNPLLLETRLQLTPRKGNPNRIKKLVVAPTKRLNRKLTQLYWKNQIPAPKNESK